jgi:hypothetical protein
MSARTEEKAICRENAKASHTLTAEEPQYLGIPFDLGEPCHITYTVEDSRGQHRDQHYDGDILDHALITLIEYGTVSSRLTATAHFHSGQQLSCDYIASGEIWGDWS